jgi:ParB family transcriptional regulator, chromosome partitioning protein
LFADLKEHEENSNELFYQKLLSLTEQQYSFLIRMAIAGKSESKYPQNETGYILYKVAESARIDVIRIEQEQEEKAESHNDRVKTKD